MNSIIEKSPKSLLYIVLGSFSILLPLYTWKRLFRRLQKNKEKDLFWQRHNCCVTYFSGKGLAGWPPYKNRIGSTLLTCDQLYEPILYFLRTAKFKVCIAVMMLTVDVIEETLCEIARKGVHVCLLLDYVKSDAKRVDRMKQAGVHIKMFVNTNTHTESLMHHKYAVKDYDGRSGYLLFGSLNWSVTGFTNNYEDIVFTTNTHAVKSFNDNFENMWLYLDSAEKHDVTVHAALSNKVKFL